MPAPRLLTPRSRPVPLPPTELHLHGGPGPDARFWAAACAAAAGLRLVVEETPDDGRPPSPAQLTLRAPQEGQAERPGQAERDEAAESSWELWAPAGPGRPAVPCARVELPGDRERLVQLLLECAGPGGAGTGLVLCHAASEGEADPGPDADRRPGLAWSVARLLSAPRHGVSVDLPSARVDGMDAALLGGDLTPDRLGRLLSMTAPGAVVVDVGADRDLAERLHPAATLGVMIGTGARAPDPPGPDWIGVRVQGRIGQGQGPADWARHLGRRSALDLGARVELAVEQRRVTHTEPAAHGQPALPSRRSLRGARS